MPTGVYNHYKIKGKHLPQQGFQKGVKHSKEHIEKIVLALKGRKPTQEQLDCLKLGWGSMKGKHHTQETIDKISETKKENPTRYWLGKKGDKRLSGENHWNWKGGLSYENNKLKHSDLYNNWRIAVYRRDYFRCKDCGKKCNKDIVAHHIMEWVKFPELRFEISNGITLCRSCHKKRHYTIGLETRFIKGRAHTKGDNSKAKKLLDWEPQISIEEGIKKI